MKPSFEVETINPEVATGYLERNVCNRKVSEAAVRRYAAEMKRGEWLFNGETIKFDDEGRLIDGQHRLLAVVRAGVSVELGVFRALKHATFKTIDTGRNRTGGDVLSICGISYASETASAARLLWLYVHDETAAKRALSNTQLLEFMDQHPELAECVDRVMRAPFLQKLIAKSAWGFCYYAASRLDRAKADRFFSELASGLYADKRTSQPAYALRERLIATAGEALPPTAPVKLGWLMVGWNAFLAGRPLGRLSRVPSGLPRFDPDPFR